MITIPRPPTTNNLYRNIGRRRARSKAYDKWVAHAGRILALQRPEHVPGPVSIEIKVEKRGKVREDIDNRIKAAVDLLVKHNVIDDDRNVQKVSAEWADVDGCEITIERVT